VLERLERRLVDPISRLILAFASLYSAIKGIFRRAVSVCSFLALMADTFVVHLLCILFLFLGSAMVAHAWDGRGFVMVSL